MLLPSHVCWLAFAHALQHAVCDLRVSAWRVKAHVAGLDAIQEQQPYKGLSPGMLQALSQLGRLLCFTLMPSCTAAVGRYTVVTCTTQPALFLGFPASLHPKISACCMNDAM